MLSGTLHSHHMEWLNEKHKENLTTTAISPYIPCLIDVIKMVIAMSLRKSRFYNHKH